MLKKSVYLLSIALAFISCTKEHNKPQWDIEVFGPLAHATLGFGQLIGDSNIVTNESGAQILSYDTLLSNFKIDSLYQVADTTIPTVVVFPPFSTTIHPNTPFYSNNNNVKLGVSGVELKQAIISKGTIRLHIKNTMHSKIIFVYTIPKAIKNGVPFTVTASVDSASASTPKYFTNDYDFSGYDVDMTGANGNSVNTIYYNVESRSDPNGYDFVVNASDTIVNLKTTLIGIEPFFVRGYLGQTETNESKDQNSGFGSTFKSGLINLDSVKLNLDFINYIGADEQAYISNVQSVNSRTGNMIDLTAPSFVKTYLNINRASINPTLTDTLVSTRYSVQLDNSNSNIKSLIENIPDTFKYNINFSINPLGNISGSNDFVFRDKLVETYVKFTIPLRFAANQLILADTVPFTISAATNFDPVGTTTLTLIANNGFPIDLNFQLFLIDKNGTVVDSLISPDFIQAAPYDLNYRATGKRRTEIQIPVDAERKQRILSVDKVGIRLKFNTPDFPQLIQMYSDYRVDLKLIADGIYSLR